MQSVKSSMPRSVGGCFGRNVLCEEKEVAIEKSSIDYTQFNVLIAPKLSEGQIRRLTRKIRHPVKPCETYECILKLLIENSGNEQVLNSLVVMVHLAKVNNVKNVVRSDNYIFAISLLANVDGEPHIVDPTNKRSRMHQLASDWINQQFDDRNLENLIEQLSFAMDDFNQVRLIPAKRFLAIVESADRNVKNDLLFRNMSLHGCSYNYQWIPCYNTVRRLTELERSTCVLTIGLFIKLCKGWLIESVSDYDLECFFNIKENKDNILTNKEELDQLKELFKALSHIKALSHNNLHA